MDDKSMKENASVLGWKQDWVASLTFCLPARKEN